MATLLNKIVLPGLCFLAISACRNHERPSQNEVPGSSQGTTENAASPPPSTSANTWKDASGVYTLSGEGAFEKKMTKADAQLCRDITAGKIDVSSFSTKDGERNSFYLECAITNFIGGPKSIDAEKRAAAAAQRKNADYLFSRDINSNYTGRFGQGLLLDVIISDLPSDVKLQWVQRLIREGADVNRSSEYGNDALRAAKNTNEVEIYNLLVDAGAVNPVRSRE